VIGWSHFSGSLASQSSDVSPAGMLLCSHKCTQQVASVLTANRHTDAATDRVTLRISITCRLFRIPYNKKGSPYSITERRVPELIPVLGSQPAGDVSHKPGGRLPLLSAMHAVTPATLKRAATNFAAWWTMGVNSLPKTVTRQRRDCDLNPGPSAPESSTLATQLLSHPS